MHPCCISCARNGCRWVRSPVYGIQIFVNVYLENFGGSLPRGLEESLGLGAMIRVENPNDSACVLIHCGVEGFSERYSELAKGPLQGAIVVVSADADAGTWSAALATGVEVATEEAGQLEWVARARSAMSRQHEAARADFGQGRIELTRASLEMISMVDLRTGMYNRQFLLASLRDEVSAAKRYKRSLSLCIFQLLNSDRIVAKHGEERLAQVREHVADEIGVMLRGADVCAWTSDNAFAAMLPETNLEGAAVAQSRMDAALGELSSELGAEVLVRSVVGALSSSDGDETEFLERVERMFDVVEG